jgi:hypothetical protein
MIIEQKIKMPGVYGALGYFVIALTRSFAGFCPGATTFHLTHRTPIPKNVCFDDGIRCRLIEARSASLAVPDRGS